MPHSLMARFAARLPFFYGWIIVAVAFVTVAIGATARTTFSLMFPPIVDEFGWERGLAAGAFSFGFLVSAVVSPLIGRLMDRFGPRLVIEGGVVVTAAGFIGAVWIEVPWHLYATLGLLVGIGTNCMTYSVHSQFLPHWFVRWRGFAIATAFAGAGVGSMLILPWLQAEILRNGWRPACWTLGIATLVVLVPINLLIAKRPQDIGLLPDGESKDVTGAAGHRKTNIVDAKWAAVDWTVGRALRTARFWWVSLAYFCGGYIWYAIQVHQTKYLVEIGFGQMEAAWSLGLVAMAAIPGQIALGALSDRMGRELVWSVSCAGFALCYVALLLLPLAPARPLLYFMVMSQGLLGYAFAALIGPVVAEIFEGPHFGAIFSLTMTALIAGGAVGPFVTGVLHDWTGTYEIAFALGLAFSILSAIALWCASPRKVRVVAGSIPS